MQDHIVDWMSLALRWIHIITGAAWIGTSFYFNWLNHNLRPLADPATAAPGRSGADDVAGELWSVHGGHFYQVLKYRVAPEKLPKTLHWFKWEAYFTWLSGFVLLVLVYYLDSGVFLIDTRIAALAPWEAISIGVGTLLVSWLAYDAACRSPLGRRPVALAILGFAAVTGVAYGLTRVFGSRAAYIHVGAMLGTWMAANVFRVIIPNQRITVDALVSGKEPEARFGIAAAQRSLHNNYFTLPVLFIMVSNHYPFTYGHEWNWAILAAISLVGAGTRHYFNLKHLGHRNQYILPAAALAMVALALTTAPRSYASFRPVAFSEVRAIVEKRCITCHSSTPTHEAFDVAPQGVKLDTKQEIAALAPRINAAVVVSKTMPLGNMTAITEDERDILGAWYYQGAQIQ